MENTVELEQNQLNILQNEEAFNKCFKNALVTNIIMENGTETSIVTLFNQKEFHFEEINQSVNHSLAKQYWIPIAKIKSIVYSLKSGIPEKMVEFD